MRAAGSGARTAANEWHNRHKRRTTRYSCNALTGGSDYNICLNADLTVSCNCQDFSGEGHIGDLRSQSLEEIFSGPRVREFLAVLAQGGFPTDVCRTCLELVVLNAEEPGAEPKEGRVPHRGIMVENTALCNLRCDLCARREDLVALRSQVSLAAEDVELVARLLRDYGIEKVVWANLGEPFLSPNILEEVRTIRRFNPDIEIDASTNGALVASEERLEAALLMDSVVFSIDGVDQDSLARYQVRGDFERSYENLKRLCAMRVSKGRERDGVRLPVVEWKYVMFRWNDSKTQLRRAVDLAGAAGVDRLRFSPGQTEAPNRSFRFYLDATFRDLGPPTPVRNPDAAALEVTADFLGA